MTLGVGLTALSTHLGWGKAGSMKEYLPYMYAAVTVFGLGAVLTGARSRQLSKAQLRQAEEAVAADPDGAARTVNDAVGKARKELRGGLQA